MFKWLRDQFLGESTEPEARFIPSSNLSRNLRRLLQGQAIVSQAIAPNCQGRVHFRGSWWPAACDQQVTLVPGEIVNVVGLSNITLIVRP